MKKVAGAQVAQADAAAALEKIKPFKKARTFKYAGLFVNMAMQVTDL